MKPVGPGEDALSFKVRRVMYRAAIVAGVLMSAVSAGYLAYGAPEPIWVRVAEAVLWALVVGFGLTADKNTPKTPAAEEALRGALADDGGADGLPDDQPRRAAPDDL